MNKDDTVYTIRRLMTEQGLGLEKYDYLKLEWVSELNLYELRVSVVSKDRKRLDDCLHLLSLEIERMRKDINRDQE